MSAVFEGGPQSGIHYGDYIRGRVDKMVILSSTLTNQSRKIQIHVDVKTNLSPQSIERSEKVNTLITDTFIFTGTSRTMRQ